MVLNYVFTVFLFTGGNNFIAIQPPIGNLTIEQCTQMALKVNTDINREEPVIGVCAPRLSESA